MSEIQLTAHEIRFAADFYLDALICCIVRLFLFSRRDRILVLDFPLSEIIEVPSFFTIRRSEWVRGRSPVILWRIRSVERTLRYGNTSGKVGLPVHLAGSYNSTAGKVGFRKVPVGYRRCGDATGHPASHERQPITSAACHH